METAIHQVNCLLLLALHGSALWLEYFPWVPNLLKKSVKNDSYEKPTAESVVVNLIRVGINDTARLDA